MGEGIKTFIKSDDGEFIEVKEAKRRPGFVHVGTADDGERFVAMCEFQGRLYVAATDGVYVVAWDNGEAELQRVMTVPRPDD